MIQRLNALAVHRPPVGNLKLRKLVKQYNIAATLPSRLYYYEGPAAIVCRNDVLYCIMQDGERGLGIFTTCRLQFPFVCGEYFGREMALNVAESTRSKYVVKGATKAFDGSPTYHGVSINGIMVGYKGEAIFAYINEFNQGEAANISFLKTENGPVYVVLCAHTVAAWQPLLTCYNDIIDTPTRHDCISERCDDLADWWDPYWQQLDPQ